VELSGPERNVLSSKKFKKGSKFSAMLNKKMISGKVIKIYSNGFIDCKSTTGKEWMLPARIMNLVP